jgi:non-canonical poly(A) RNA polymerase PAPD5/7
MIDGMQPYLLCLQDPADPLNDLGRKGYGFKHIQATMGHLLKKLRKYTAHENHGTTSILAPLVGSCFKTYSKRREMAEAYGRERLENTIL